MTLSAQQWGLGDEERTQAQPSEAPRVAAVAPVPGPAAKRRPEGQGPVEDWCSVLERLAAGDVAAHTKVSGVILGLLARSRAFDLEPLWEDICQDVLAAVVRSVQRGAIRDPRAFVGYCAVITRNELSRRMEELRRARMRASLTEAEELPEEESVCDLDLRIDIERALSALPERVRKTVSAIYLEGRTYEDASRNLGMPLGTLKRMQTQGLRMLREALPAW